MLLRTLLEKTITKGTLHLHLPDGSERCFGAGSPQAEWHILSHSALRRISRDPEYHLGQTYMEGEWHCGDSSLPQLLQVLMTNIAQRQPGRFARLYQAVLRLFHRGNRIVRSYQNVQHHYDLDEWLFREFLDENMFYSCAYFEHPGQSLAQAQLAKCELLSRKLLLTSGQRVLDIGSGWGGLAFYLAEHSDVEVVGLTLSKEQLRVARQQAQQRGLGDQVRFYLEDYRQHSGEYDRIVSVGMFEHVGLRHFSEFFSTLEKMLKPDGVAMVHTIGCTDRSVTTNSWIAEHIFPGGYIPSLSEITCAIEQQSLFYTDIEVLRLHYADTLAHWFTRFQARRERIAHRMGESFCRMWEFYLASCEASFRYWDLVVYHLQLAHQHQVVPQTRDYLYAGERPRYVHAQPPHASAPVADSPTAFRESPPVN